MGVLFDTAAADRKPAASPCQSAAGRREITLFALSALTAALAAALAASLTALAASLAALAAALTASLAALAAALGIASATAARPLPSAGPATSGWSGSVPVRHKIPPLYQVVVS